METELQALHRYRVAHGLMAQRSVVDEAMEEQERRLGKGGAERPRARLVNMYAFSSTMQLTGPFRITAKIPATPAVVVAIPKIFRESWKREKFSQSREAWTESSRVSASLRAHVSNRDESFAVSFPYRNRRSDTRKNLRSN